MKNVLSLRVVTEDLMLLLPAVGFVTEMAIGFVIPPLFRLVPFGALWGYCVFIVPSIVITDFRMTAVVLAAWLPVFAGVMWNSVPVSTQAMIWPVFAVSAYYAVFCDAMKALARIYQKALALHARAHATHHATRCTLKPFMATTSGEGNHKTVVSASLDRGSSIAHQPRAC
jgi:hypothetical protein